MLALSVSHLTKRYADGTVALDDVSLEVKPGEIFGLLGPNGAGKSTLIGIMTSLVKKTSGEALIFGQDIAQNANEAKKQLGLMPQEFNFNNFEQAEQILVNCAGYFGVPYEEAMQRAELLLKKLELWDKRHHVVRALSGGMKRRLMIARALMHKPDFLILDEPTAGVDVELRRTIWEFARELNQEGVTILLTTHYLEEAENLCDRIVFINKGKVIKEGTPKSLTRHVKSETLILDLKAPLDKAPELEGLDCKLESPCSLSINLNPSETPLNVLFNKLNEAGLEVTGFKNKTNRLEELFVELTGE